MNVKMSKAFGDAWRVMWRHPILMLISVGLAYFVGNLFLFLLLGSMIMSVFAMCDRLVVDDFEKPKLMVVINGFRYLISGFVLMLIAISGVLVLGVGHLITTPIAMMAMLRIVDTKKSLISAVKESYDIIIRNGQLGFFLMADGMLIVVAWSCALWLICLIVPFFVVGIFVLQIVVVFLLAWFHLALVCAYRQLFQPHRQQV